MAILPFSSTQLSRRTVVGSGISGAALLSLASIDRAVTTGDARSIRTSQNAADELTNWKMWLLAAPDELRPSAPGSVPEEEIEEVVGYLAAPSEEMKVAIGSWGTTPATAPWTATAIAAFAEFRVSGMRQARNLALLHTAMHDAAVAAWDAQVSYGRPSPGATDDRIVPGTGVDPALPTFPSDHAAIAAAAAAVLSYLHPDAAGRFDDLAEGAAMSRVWAGAAFPSDVEAGLMLGKAVGERAVARGQSDGSDAVFDPSTMPAGPGVWVPTPPAFADPIEPLGGTWKAWILERNDQFRPSPPPDYDSPLWQSELTSVQEIVQSRTLAQQTDAIWWQTAANFYDWTHELVARHGLDTPHAARVLAYQAASMADAVTAVWDAKYTWWTSRPITEDPDLVTAFPAPPYPAYPSGYSAYIGAMSQMAGLFFPDAAEQLDELCWRSVRSRAWAGIHYPIDNEVGMSIGRRVARLAAVRALEEGAIPA